MSTRPIRLSHLLESLPEDGLFAGGNWKWSPQPLPLRRAEARQLMSMGHPLARFQQASDVLYRRSASGSAPAWISDWLDRGKPAWLCDWQKLPNTANQQPRVIRPDLIACDHGFAMTELDSVPGGIGITAWLSKTYSAAGFDVLGGPAGMLNGFRSLLPAGGSIVISDEAGDYRPEMQWLARELGSSWRVLRAEDGIPDNAGPLYRFFELFDWQSIPDIRDLARHCADGSLSITPPFKPHLEEKLWLALLWIPSLRPYWKSLLRANHLQRLYNWIPRGWAVDPEPLPPLAALPGLQVHSWRDVADFSQKDRRMVLKISGFHETAWGSRGVHIGHDLPAAEWRQAIESSLAQAEQHPWMVQEFREGKIIRHPVFRDDGSITEMNFRARLCPYYFTDADGDTRFGGCLATLVPADKKKIHGMRDAVLVPCCIDDSEVVPQPSEFK